MKPWIKSHRPAVGAYRVLRPPAGLAIFLWLGLQAQPAYAVDCTDASDGATLATAIGEVNAGSCDTINITGNIALSSQNLPIIDRSGATITIQGSGGQRIVDGTGTSRLFAVVNGDVTLSDINIENGLAQGGGGGGDNRGGGAAGGALGAGGGLFIGAGGTVTLRNVDLGGNVAQGGDGGDAAAGSGGAGAGGGGLNGGAGGSGSTGAVDGGAGGGGGFGADGGGFSTERGGAGGGGGGNNAAPGAPGTGGNPYPGGSGGTGDSGEGGDGANGDSGDTGAAGSGMGGGGGGGSSNNSSEAGDGGAGGALGGGGGGGGEAHFATSGGVGAGGAGGAGGFGGGGGGGGQSYKFSVTGTWNGGAGGLGGFGAGGGGGGSSSASGGPPPPTPAGGAGGAGGFLGGDGGDGGAVNGGSVAGGGGGGGAGLGGAIFVQNGGQLNIGQSVTFGGNTVSGGAGGAGATAGTAGGTAGANIYAIDGAAGLGSNATVGFDLDTGQPAALTDADLGMLQAGYSGQLRKTGDGELVLQSTSGFTTGGWSVVAGTLQGNTDNLIGAIANDGELVLDQSFDGTLAGDLTGSGSLVKEDSGNVTLSGNNDAYTGDVQIDAGTLTVNGSGLGDTSAVTVGGGTLAVGAAGETIGSLAGGGNVSLGGALDVGGNDSSTTYSGNLSGSGSLTKSGTGDLTVTGTNSYTGGTTIDAGTLIGTTSSLIGDIVNNSALEFAQAFDGTHAGDISGSGSLTKSGSGNVTLSGNNDAATGSVQIDAGTLTVNGSGLGDTSAVTVGGGSLAVGAAGETTGSLAGSGDVSLGGALDVGGNNASTVFSGDISGSGSLTKTGTGTLLLNGTNGYTGGTTIDAGTLIGMTSSLVGDIVNNSALVFAQTVDGTHAGDISGSGSLSKAGNGALTLSGTNSYTGGTTITDGTLIGTTSSLTGDIVNDGALEFDQATNGTHAGDISGSGGLTKSGSGTVTLSGTNSYTGGTTIDAGTLIGTTSSLIGDIVNNSALEFAQAFDGTHAGDISGSGSLTKSGSGNVTLSGNNDAATGSVQIDAGTLTVNGSGLGDTSAVTVGGGTLAIGAAGETIGSLAGSGDASLGGALDVGGNDSSTTYSGNLSGSGSLTKSGTGDLTLSGTNSYTGGTTIDAGTLIGTTSSLIGDIVNNSALEFAQAFDGTHAGDISGSGSLTKSGSGTVTLSGTNSYTGGTTITDGTLVGTTSSLNGDIVNDGALAFDQATNGTYAGQISGSGGLTKAGNGTVTLSGTNSYTGGTTITDGTLVGTTSSLTGDVVNDGALEFDQATNGTYAGQISGSGGLTKSGSGSVTLTGTNSYSGGTTIDAGTLIGTTSSLIGDIVNNSALEFDQAFDGTHAGDISGSGGLTKSGSGTVTLSGANSYSGGTTITDGTLVGTTSSLTGDIFNDSALEFDQATDGTYAGDISGSGSLTKSGNGSVTLTGTNSYSGGTTIDAGALIGTTSSLVGDIVNNSALEFAQTFDGTYAGDISGSGGLTKSGSGTVTLSGTNSYTGGTTIDAGTLRGTALTLTGDILNNATIEFTQSADGTYAGDISGTGGLVKTGAGTLTLTGMNNYTGLTTVTAGTLSVNGAVLSSVNVSSGATLTGSGGVGQVVSQGIVAPGNSIGTMTVTGDMTLDPGGILEIEFDDLGNADRLVVTGTVTLGGTLRLLPEAGGYVKNTQYLIIDAGTVAGAFADGEVVDETRLAGLEAVITITADEVLIELVEAAFSDDDDDDGSASDYIDDLRSGASGDLADVIAELEVLPLDALEAALRSLSPQTVDAIPTVQAAYGRLLTHVMQRRLQGLRDENLRNGGLGNGGLGAAFPAGLGLMSTSPEPDTHSTGSLISDAAASWEDGLLALVGTTEQAGSIVEVGDVENALWLQLIGEYGTKDDVDEFLGYQYTLLGAISGFEHRLSPDWQLGANVALGHSEVEFNHDRGSSDGMSYAGGVYLGWSPLPGVAIDLLGWGGMTRFENNRNIAFGSLERQADAETDVQSLGAELRGEMSGDWGAFSFAGFGSVSYTSNWQDDYCETGAGAINLCVDAMRTSEVGGALGARVSYDVEVDSGVLTLDAEAAVTANQPLDDRIVRAGFDGQAGSFVTPGDDDRELGLSPKIGLSYQLDDQLRVTAHYSGHFGQDVTAHGVHLGLEFRF